MSEDVAGRRSRGRRRARHRAQPSAADDLRRRRRLPAQGRAAHRCLVLANGPDDITAVELRTGAFVRLRTTDTAPASAPAPAPAPAPAAGEPAGPPGPPDRSEQQVLLPFDVVDATWAEDPQRDDLAQPEAVTIAGPPELVGSLRGRKARRVLKGLVASPEQHLLGFPGSAAPYWEFHGMRPSVTLVAPSRGPVLFRRKADDSVWARFGGPRSDHWLPVEDRRALACLWTTGRDRLSGRSLAGALGFRPQYVLVTVSRPRQGHCYKTVAALLPRP